LDFFYCYDDDINSDDDNDDNDNTNGRSGATPSSITELDLGLPPFVVIKALPTKTLFVPILSGKTPRSETLVGVEDDLISVSQIWWAFVKPNDKNNNNDDDNNDDNDDVIIIPGDCRPPWIGLCVPIWFDNNNNQGEEDDDSDDDDDDDDDDDG